MVAAKKTFKMEQYFSFYLVHVYSNTVSFPFL